MPYVSEGKPSTEWVFYWRRGSGLFEGALEFATEFLAVGEVELVFLNEKLAIHLVGGVFDEKFVFLASEDDADGRVVALGVFLGGEVAEIHVHLADVMVCDLV